MLSLVIRIVLILLVTIFWQCSSDPAKKTGSSKQDPSGMIKLSTEEMEAGWQLLFNGLDASAWRGYNRDTLPGSWMIEDGHLVCRKLATDRGDIISKEKYQDFELVLEVMYFDTGNSGVFHRVEEVTGQPMWTSAPEYQLLDNTAYASMFGDQFPSHGVGECYELYAAEKDYSHPLGEWNKVKIISLGNHVQYWLNGFLTVSFEISSPDWEARVAKSKFSPYQSRFGKSAMGHIGLQNHGQDVRFKNIKIRKIDNQ